ncbi:MAG: pantetheine-phosphate adenylyltransferase [Nitriliruptoraceae bacterium]
MSVAVACPGSFDPVTYGHLDVIERAAARFDEVVVAVLVNPGKQGLFSIDERIALLEAEVAGLGNVRVDRFQGLLVDFCAARGIGLVCKGLRAVSDFEYELQMAQMNMAIGDVETVFLTTSPEHSYLSSSLVKEVARFGGRIDHAVPPRVEAAVRAKLA